MVDSVMVFEPGFRMLDANGDPVSGAKANFYEAGTTSPKTVYSDRDLGGGSSLGAVVYSRSDGFWVASSGSSTIVAVFTGSGLYKLIITDADDVTIWSGDNLRGALDTSTFLTSASTSTLSIPVVNTSGPTLAVGTSHRGKLIDANTGGANVTLTLDAAATLGDGWNVKLRKDAAANALIIQTTGGETLYFANGSHAALSLVGLGEEIEIICDGTAFHVSGHVPRMLNAVGVLLIEDRVTSAPVGPTAGARYIVTSAYSTFSVGDVIEYDGVSGYTAYTPAADCGWLAYVKDEDRYYSFQGSAWVLGVEPAASDTVAGVQRNATQAEMETGTSTALNTTPGRQHFHPAHPKAWGVVTVSGGTPTLAASHNVTSITDTGLGILAVTLDVDFASAAYAITCAVERASAGAATTDTRTPTVKFGTQAAGTFQLDCWDGSPSLKDPAAWHFSAFGDQA